MMHDGGSVPQEPALLPAGFEVDDDKPLKRQPELVRDVFPRDGTGALIGQSGSGKTFTAVHAGVCISSGEHFFGREVVEQVGCVHLAYENGGNIKHRVRAARLHAGFDERTPIPFIYAARSGNLLDPKHFDATARALKACNKYFKSRFGLRLGFVTVDTQSAAFITQDENSNAEIVKVCKVLIGLGREIDAFVLGVHHMGKDPKAGARGASARRDNVDFQMLCLADRETLTGKCSNHRLVIDKNRDGQEGPIGAFELVPVEIGREENGELFSSLAVRFTGEASASAAKTRGPSGRTGVVLRALEIAIEEAGEPAPASNFIPRTKRVVRLDRWRRYCEQLEFADTDNAESRLRLFGRERHKLQTLGLVGVFTKCAWLIN